VRRTDPMKVTEPLSVEDQLEILADRYSQRAEAYDRLWSPVIRPIGEHLLRRLPLADADRIVDVGTGSGALLPAIRRAAPTATVLGIDRSEGMLELARQKHRGPLALMDAQRLDLPSDAFDVAVVAFVLFHLPDPVRCLSEVIRVLRPGGVVGTATWAREQHPSANAIWDEELAAAGAQAIELPATESRASSNSTGKVVALLDRAGFAQTDVWTETIEYGWSADAHFEWHVCGTSRVRLQSLEPANQDACLSRVRERLGAGEGSQYTFRGEVVLATAVRPPSSTVQHARHRRPRLDV